MSFCAKLSPSSKILTNWSARNHRQGPMGDGQRMVVTTNLWTCWIPLQPPSEGGNVLNNVIERETRLKSGPKLLFARITSSQAPNALLHYGHKLARQNTYPPTKLDWFRSFLQCPRPPAHYLENYFLFSRRQNVVLCIKFFYLFIFAS